MSVVVLAMLVLLDGTSGCWCRCRCQGWGWFHFPLTRASVDIRDDATRMDAFMLNQTLR